MITPQTLKGFRDYLPETMMAREQLMETARRVFRSYGFVPIETPALEYSEILLGKGGLETDKQLFRFLDQGGRDVSLRFDLTVPLARFVAQHYNELVFPFRRYHLAPVWRAENPQRGRFREFVQCDADIIGTTSPEADAETALLMHDLLTALGFDAFTVRLNNRLVLTGLLEALGLAEQQAAVLRALDKLDRQGAATVREELVNRAGATGQQAEQLVQRITELAQGAVPNGQVLAQLEGHVGDSAAGKEGVARLAELLRLCAAAGVTERLRIDVSIARGLDYYTGTVYETVLDNLPSIGSVCSGGRYDNLAGLYMKQQLPGVGASLGLDRLLAAMEELGRLPKRATTAAVFIVHFVTARVGDYLRVARQLRAGGIAVEVYPEAKAIDKQLKYADRKGFRLALIAGEREFAQDVWQVKDLTNRSSTEVSSPDVLQRIRELLTQ